MENPIYNNNYLYDCNWTRTRNHFVLKRTLNHLAKLVSLAKWLSVRLRTKWFWVRVQLQSLYIQVVCFAALWDTFLSTSPHTHSPPKKKKKLAPSLNLNHKYNKNIFTCYALRYFYIKKIPANIKKISLHI